MLKTLNHTCVCLVVFLLVAGFASFTFGHGGGGDIALYGENGKVGVGFAVLDDNDIDQEFFDPNDVVHQSILIPQPPIPPFFVSGSTEPGFDANEFELTPDASVFVNSISLGYWNGLGGVEFTDSAIDFGYSPLPLTTDGEGGFHAHPVFGLGNQSGALDDGVYVAELTVSVDGMDESDPYYLVTLVDGVITNDADPEGAAEFLGELIRDYQADRSLPPPTYSGKDFTFYVDAVDFVETQVPEPAMATLLGWAGLMLVVFCRRS